MATHDLSLSPPAVVPDDPIAGEGEGLYVRTLARKKLSRGWLRPVGRPGERPVEMEPIQFRKDYRKLGDDAHEFTYGPLADGTYEADTATPDGQARRVTFTVKGGAFRLGAETRPETARLF